MINTLRIRPPYSVLLIEGGNRSELPSSFNNSIFSATNTCIAVGCNEENEETEVSIELRNAGVLPTAGMGETWFSSEIDTPDREIVLRAVDGIEYTRLGVSSVRTTVSIFADDAQQPSALSIYCSPSPGLAT